jgi:eukaryotic-like serine/threonine-protein kinase
MIDLIHRCSGCDSECPADAPGSLCPRCLMRLGLAEVEVDPDELASQQELEETTATIEPRLTVPEPPSGEPDHASGIPPPHTVVEVHPEAIARRAATQDMPEDGRHDRLRLLEVIARGGMGVIYRGRDADLNRDVAIKVLQEKHRDIPELVRRFVEEAQIAGQLQHPGVVPIHELGVFADHRPYFVMKLVRGQTLAEILAAHFGPPQERHRLLPVFLQVAQTVAYAHAHGVVHGDLSPSNVMVGKFGEVQVMDWGLAQVVSSGGGAGQDLESASSRAPGDGIRERASRPRRVMGTPGYMAPEQFACVPHQVDPRADVFALGSILCEILTGQPAYDGDAARQARGQFVPPDLSQALVRLRSCGASEELVELVRDCWSLDPQQRPRDAGELAARLTAYLDGVGERFRIAELAHVEAQARADAERTRRRLAVGLAGAILTLVVLGGGGLAWYAQYRQRQWTQTIAALREVERLRDEAAADPTGGPDRWKATQAAVLQARIHLARLADAASIARLEDLTREVVRELSAAEADRQLLDRLEDARARSVEGDPKAADAEYAAAFREVRLDVDQQDPIAVGRVLAGRPEMVRPLVVAALDDWAISRRHLADDAGERWSRPLEAARAADPDPWRNQLRDALQAGNREALIGLSGSDDLEQRPAPSLWLLGRALIGVRDMDRAAAVLRRAWRVHPGDFWINLDLSHALAWSRPPRTEEAQRYATAAVTARPGSAVAHMGLAIFLHQSGDRTAAEAEFRAALRLQPNDALARYNLGNLLFDQRRITEAVDQYREALRLHPRQATYIHNNLGEALSQIGRLEEAAVEFRATLLASYADVPEVRLNLASTLVRLGRLEEAAAEFRAAIRKKPDLFAAWSGLGFVRLQQGDRTAAAEALRRAAELAIPGSAQALQVKDALRQATLVDPSGSSSSRSGPVQ